MLAAETTLLAASIVVAGAFLARAAFRRFHLPDVPLLVGLGVVLAPGLGLVDAGLLKSALPIVGAAAVVLVLFEGGLRIRPEDLRAAAGRGAVLAVAVFLLTTLLCAAVGWLVAGLPPALALLLGACFGGAGVLIVIPLAAGLGVSEDAKTVVTVEAVVSDVLVVLGVVTLATVIAAGGAAPDEVAAVVSRVVAVGLVFGAAAGFAWAAFLRRARPERHAYALTAAALFASYVGTELLAGSGLLAVLAFGFVVGNSRVDDVLGPVAMGVQDEAVFILRAFFFVALGGALDFAVLASAHTLLVGSALALAVFAARVAGTALFARNLESWDRLVVALMFPLGLAAAVLALVPFERFGLPGTENFGAYAAVAVVATNVLASVAVLAATWARSREARASARAAATIALATPWRR